MPGGPAPPDPRGKMPDLRAEEKRAFGFGDSARAGPRPDDGLARGAAQQRRPGVPPRAGPGDGRGAPHGGPRRRPGR